MDRLETMVAAMEQKIRNCKVKTRVLILEDRGEIHISISHHNMGKRHKNVRQTILDRVRKNRTLSRYTIYLFRNPTHPGRACMTFVLNPRTDHWEDGFITMLPDEALVA